MLLFFKKPSFFPTLAPKGDRISILQYADDTLLFIQAPESTADKLNRILQMFVEEAGQVVNRSKSKLIL